jgi:hypothetical protein
MAAETLTGSRAANTFPVFKALGAGLMCVAYGTYEIGAAVEAGDVFEMCKLPPGATVVGGWFLGDDIDTGATETLDMDLGWAANGAEAADPDGLGNFGTLTGDAFAAGSVSIAAGLAYPILPTNLPSFTKETTVQLEVNTASAGGHTGTVTVIVYYVAD